MIGHMTYFEDFSFGPKNGQEVDRKWVKISHFCQIFFLVSSSQKLISEPVLVNKYAQTRIFTEDPPIDYGDLIGKN